MNEIVKYNNILNELKLGTFKAMELDFLMALCYQFKDKESQKMTFSFAEIRKLTGFSKLSNQQVYDILDGIGDKITDMKLQVKTEKGKRKFVLFIDYEIADDFSTYSVGVHPEFTFVLNDIAENFTSFELQEFVKLKSKYSKNLYRLLKQFDSSDSGWRLFVADDLREKLGCPTSYPNKRFVADILNPCIKELETIFDGLKMEIVRARKKGAPITHFKFSWKVAVNDELEGQMHISDFIDMPKEDLTQEEKAKVLKIASDIVKGSKKKETKSAKKDFGFTEREYSKEEWARAELKMMDFTAEQIEEKIQKMKEEGKL